MLKLSLLKNYFFIVILLILPAVVALSVKGYFPMHDDIQGMRVLQMHKCLLDFQIPCRWVPDMGFGYGYPQFNYYAPLPYYFMAVAVSLGYPILASVKLGFAISLVASATAMYLLGAKLWGKAGGAVSALMYTYAPYRAVDIYVRGAMGEAWAFVFLPLILLYTLKILEGKRAILPLSLSLAGLALSHNVTVLMFLPFYALFVLTIRKLDSEKVKSVIVAGLWALALSAFFVLPAYFEKEYVHVETILQGYFNYLAHFVGFRQLLFSTFWGYGVSSLGPLDGMSLSVGILGWGVPLLVVLMLFYLKKAGAKTALLFILFGFIALFLIHPRSQLIWDSISILSYIQFPWRFLALVVLFLSIAAGALGKLVSEYKLHALGTLFVILILFYGSNFTPGKYLDVTDGEKFSGESLRQQQTISIFDYLPKAATAPPDNPAPEYPYSDAGVEVRQGSTGTNWQKWALSVPMDAEVIFPIFNFPVWRAKVDNLSVPVESTTALGLVTVNVPAGDHEVSLRLANTPIRTFSNIISLVALLLVPVYLKTYAKRQERS